jgi:RHS repeat-associated protein
VPDGSATYDEDGRQLTVGEESTFGYDAFGRLAEVHNENGTCNYEYDALGRRVREDCDGEVVLFGYSGPNLVVEQRGAQAVATVHAGLSAPVFRVPLSGGGPIPLGGGFGGSAGASEATYLLTGKDGSVRAALNPSGQVVETYTYSAFGETSVTTMPGHQPTGNRFGFQGHYHDPSTGLYQMRARYYAPRWGRFLTPDPLGVAATGNPYAFVGNRPGDLWDPFGLSPVANPNGQSMGGAVSFTPSHNAVTHWVLYSDNWFTNGIQDDSNLEYVQNGVLVATIGVEAGILVVATGGGAAAAFTAGGGTAGLEMSAIRAGWMMEDYALAEAGTYTGGAGTVYMASRGAPAGGKLAEVAGEALESATHGGGAEIAGAGTGGARVAPFNPSGSMSNCVNGVCAFLNSVKNGRLFTASADVTENLGSVRTALRQIEAGTGARIGAGQFNQLATGRARQFFIVFKGSSASMSEHVAIGIVNNERRLIYDPQIGTTFYNLSDFGTFTAYPVGF